MKQTITLRRNIMKKNLFALSLSSITVIAFGCLFAFNANDIFSSKGRAIENEGYQFVLNGTRNVLSNDASTGVFELSNTDNKVAVSYSGYNHSSDSSWGTLADGGYFGLSSDARVGGLTSITYHIDSSSELSLEFGYMESGKPTYYDATLPGNLNSLNFPEDKGYPDTFKISNASGAAVDIIEMTFYYSCSEHDDHHHVDTGALEREINGGVVKYYDTCDICEQRFEKDLSNYKIKVGTSSGDLVEYTPYNYSAYTGIGTLDFDYDGTIGSGAKRFVLTLDGDHTGSNVYVDANSGGDYGQLVVKTATGGATIHDFTFKSGFGTLIFIGDTLTLYQGCLDTEARYTTVIGSLKFDDGRKTKDAFKIAAGQLTLESTSNVVIDGYNVGIRLGIDAVGTRDFYQNGGTLTVKNTDRVMVSKTTSSSGEYTGNFYLNGTSVFESCNYVASFSFNLIIGGDATFKQCTRTIDGGTITVNGNALFDDCQFGVMNTTLQVNGSVKMTSCYHGIHYSNVTVGDNTHAGNLLISVDPADGASSSDKAVGIFIPKTNRINFAKGQAAIYSTNKDTNTSAVKIAEEHGWDKDILTVASDFKYGFANIKFGFYGASKAVDNNTYSNTNADTFFYHNVNDLANYCVVKPVGTDTGTTAAFKEMFGITD